MKSNIGFAKHKSECGQTVTLQMTILIFLNNWLLTQFNSTKMLQLNGSWLLFMDHGLSKRSIIVSRFHSISELYNGKTEERNLIFINSVYYQTRNPT